MLQGLPCFLESSALCYLGITDAALDPLFIPRQRPCPYIDQLEVAYYVSAPRSVAGFGASVGFAQGAVRGSLLPTLIVHGSCGVVAASEASSAISHLMHTGSCGKTVRSLLTEHILRR